MHYHFYTYIRSHVASYIFIYENVSAHLHCIKFYCTKMKIFEYDSYPNYSIYIKLILYVYNYKKLNNTKIFSNT